MEFIPVNEPLIGGNEGKYLARAVDSGWLSSEGPFVAEFEEKFCRQVNQAHGVMVSNGSAALELAVRALGLGDGDEVIVPAFTIISCAQAVVRAGATPVLVDSDIDSWNMDTNAIEAKITPRTKAIMAVHTYGLPVDMGAVRGLARSHGLKIIEDAAEAIGLTFAGKPCGSFGDISIFSFYANKHVTTGEGGMVVTGDADLAERCRWYRNLCFGSDRFVHDELGWNMRPTNLQAAVGLAQLERLEKTTQIKRRMGRRYKELLAGLDGVQLPLEATDGAQNVHWVYGLVLGDSVPFDAKEAMNRLSELKIGTRPFFWPMHEQPVFKKMGLFAGESHPVAERLSRRGFYVPSGVALTDAQMNRVAEALIHILG
jgi:perosamine synthetase